MAWIAKDINLSLPAGLFTESPFFTTTHSYTELHQNTWWGRSRGMNLTVQKGLLFPLPPENISHQSPFPQIQIPISIDKSQFINKLDSFLQFYTNVYNSLGFSLKLFDLSMTSGLLTVRDIHIS